jgi:hypothetical protein
MVNTAYDCGGVIDTDLVPVGSSLTGDYYANRPQLLGAGVLVFHDSSRAHIAPAASGKHCFSPLIVLTGVLISIPSEG